MPSESFVDLSPEEKFARKLAAQELVKYCQEFSRWRKTNRGSAALDKSQPVPGTQGAPPVKKPAPPAPYPSA